VSTLLSNGTNAVIGCPLKKSTIAWVRCEQYRDEYNCLCKEARDRLKIKGQGHEALDAQLRRIKKPAPDCPVGWQVDRKTRFYVIVDDQGEIVHRATNQREAEDYVQLVARVQHLEEENQKLWAILRDELVEDPKPIEIEYDFDLIEKVLAY